MSEPCMVVLIYTLVAIAAVGLGLIIWGERRRKK